MRVAPATLLFRIATADAWLVAAALLPQVAALRPAFLVVVALPGWLAGMALCRLQGDGEHASSTEGVSFHARLYNRLWFNDGYHAEHHRSPGEHWTRLPSRRRG